MKKRIKNLIILWLLIINAMLAIFAALAFGCIKGINASLEDIKAAQAATEAKNDALRAEIDLLYEEIERRFDESEHWQEITDLRLKNHYSEINESKDKIDRIEKQKKSIISEEQGKRRSQFLSQTDIRNIASLVYLECGSEDYRCQLGVASVIINRMARYNKTATQVIYEEGVFSPAYKVPYTSPSVSCLKAVRSVLNNGSIFPKSVVAFRNNRYHSFGKPYCRIGNVYFSSM